MASSATPAIAALVAAGVPHEVLRYEHDPRATSFGEEAADELGATAGVAADQVLAEPAAAQRSTGYVVGGISPLGQRKALPTVVDASALEWDRVLCSAGKRGWDVALAPRDLVALTHAVTADLQLQ